MKGEVVFSPACLLLAKQIQMKFIILLLFSGTVLLSCGQDKASAPAAGGNQLADLPEDFKTFYQKFHSDSIYQIEHIVFPLEGLPDKADSLTIASGNFRWQKENWRMQRAVDFDLSDFTRKLVPVNEVMVVEYIVHKNGKFGMERRFAKFGDEWNLIYYAGLNRFSSQ